ncbi:hypothetical protein BIW11_04349 [Tropilaelaps mercedesae]|uniref:Uncharacterized protein n=1 Tax=Tropilaelaps mercedesae TaxID=418985 RepID=A0A1V9X7K0_9ACAR|nr:hypothetical protein BIW11_04349 [Tropilaelaps mercedesae]
MCTTTSTTVRSHTQILPLPSMVFSHRPPHRNVYRFLEQAKRPLRGGRLKSANWRAASSHPSSPKVVVFRLSVLFGRTMTVVTGQTLGTKSKHPFNEGWEQKNCGESNCLRRASFTRHKIVSQNSRNGHTIEKVGHGENI